MLDGDADLDADEAERLLREAMDAEQVSIGAHNVEPSFPDAPTHASSPEVLPISAAVQAEARSTWCHICRADAHVWCVDCGDEAFCATCWRTTHAQSWSPAELRKHRTVPCRAVRLAGSLPSAPPHAPTACPSSTGATTAVSSGGTATGGRVSGSPFGGVPLCHGCGVAAYVYCSQCEDTAYCQKCWREVHALLPEMRLHKVVKIRR